MSITPLNLLSRYTFLIQGQNLFITKFIFWLRLENVSIWLADEWIHCTQGNIKIRNYIAQDHDDAAGHIRKLFAVIIISEE